MKKLSTNFPKRYDSTYPKIEAILKMPSTDREKELAFKRYDHWLVDVWRRDFKNQKERLDQVIDKVDADIGWVKEVRVDCAPYLKVMMGYEMPLVQIDSKKIKPHFHKKIEDGMSYDITIDFMSFAF